jgi:hypothetical protein
MHPEQVNTIGDCVKHLVRAFRLNSPAASCFKQKGAMVYDTNQH